MHSLVRTVLINILYAAEGRTLTKYDDKRIESTELCFYESVGLRAPYRPHYVDRAEHHQTAMRSTRICYAPQALLLWPHNQRRWVRAKVCDTEVSAWETTAWKTFKSNMTPHSGNIAKWMVTGLRKKMKTELNSKQHLYKITEL